MASIEYIAEELVMNMMTKRSGLNAYAKKHGVEDEKALINTLIVKATQGTRQPDGARAYEVSVSVFIHTKLAKAANDAVADDILKSVYENDGSFTVPTGLLFAEVLPETEADREDLKNVRKREVKFPLLIKI